MQPPEGTMLVQEAQLYIEYKALRPSSEQSVVKGQCYS